MAEADNELWMRVSPYLDRALELDGSELQPWLAALDSAHPQLAAELRELLALHFANRASGFMERAPLGPDDSLVGQRIGAYTIERLLGRGGMGSVWLGRRQAIQTRTLPRISVPRVLLRGHVKTRRIPGWSEGASRRPGKLDQAGIA